MGKLIWIASYPKSGNTWMRLFLYAYYKLGQGPLDRIDLDAPDFKTGSMQDNARSWYEPMLPVPWDKADFKTTAQIRPHVQERMAKSVQGLGFAKTHNVLSSFFGAPTINAAVTAGAIYIVRNPLDVVLSAKQHFGAKTYGKVIQQMNRDGCLNLPEDRFVHTPIGSWSENVGSWAGQPRDRIMILRYEDMLDNPAETFGRVIRTVNFEFDADRLDRAIALTSFDKLQKAEQETGFSETSRNSEVFFRAGKKDGWRAELTTGQVKMIVEKNHALMRRFGYLDEQLARFIPKEKLRRAR